MEKQKQVAVMINGLCIVAVVFLKKELFISLICLTLIMLVNFWNLLELKKKAK